MSNIPRTVGHRVNKWEFKGKLFFNGLEQFCEDSSSQQEVKIYKLQKEGLIQIKGSPCSLKVEKWSTQVDTVFRDGYWHLYVQPIKYNPYYFNVKVMLTETQFLTIGTKFNGLPHRFPYKEPFEVLPTITPTKAWSI